MSATHIHLCCYRNFTESPSFLCVKRTQTGKQQPLHMFVHQCCIHGICRLCFVFRLTIVCQQESHTQYIHLKCSLCCLKEYEGWQEKHELFIQIKLKVMHSVLQAMPFSIVSTSGYVCRCGCVWVSACMREKIWMNHSLILIILCGIARFRWAPLMHTIKESRVVLTWQWGRKHTENNWGK